MGSRTFLMVVIIAAISTGIAAADFWEDSIYTFKAGYYGNFLSAGSDKVDGMNNAYDFSMGMFFKRAGISLGITKHADADLGTEEEERTLQKQEAAIMLDIKPMKDNPFHCYIGYKRYKIDINHGTGESHWKEKIDKEVILLGVSTVLRIKETNWSWFVNGDYGIDIGGSNDDPEETDFNKYADEVTEISSFNFSTGMSYIFPGSHFGLNFGVKYQNLDLSSSVDEFPYSYKDFENYGAFIGIGIIL